MKLVLAYILTLFTSLSLSSFGQEFKDNVSTYYEAYAISDLSKEGEYELLVSSGLCNGEYSFGVYFYPDDSKGYQVTILYKDQVFKFPLNNNDYVESYRNGLTEDIKLVVLDKDYKKVEEINVYTLHANFLKGQNTGVERSRLISLNNNINKQLLIYGISGGVIIISLTILLILYTTRQGLFKIEKKQREVYSVKNLDDEVEIEPFDPTAEAIEKYQEEHVEEVKVEEKQLSQEELKDYLKEKGYIIEYSLVSEEEKNKIMVEVMVLRNKGKISEETYKKEVVEIWKN